MADSARRPRLRPPACRGASRACKRVDAFGAPAGNAERSRVRNAALSFPSRRAAGSGSATRSRPIPSRRCPALGRAFRVSGRFRKFPDVSGRIARGAEVPRWLRHVGAGTRLTPRHPERGGPYAAHMRACACTRGAASHADTHVRCSAGWTRSMRTRTSASSRTRGGAAAALAALR